MVTEHVTIFIPTYKNYHLIFSCIGSCIAQTYKNIKIVVVDNGYSEDQVTLLNKINSLNDHRVQYINNNVNIGSQNNFHLIFEMAQLEKRFIIIPADIDLSPTAIHDFVLAYESNRDVAIIFPRIKVCDISAKTEENKTSELGSMIEWPKGNSGKIKSTVLILQFFSNHNIKSEWTHFSFIGSLIDGAYFRSLGVHRWPMYDHGLEEYICLHLLSFTEHVYLLDKPLLNLYVNNCRHGSAVRPGWFYTRYEPLYAELKYLKEYEPLIIRSELPICSMQFATVVKFIYTIIRYPGPVLLLAPDIIGVIFKLIFAALFKLIRIARKFLSPSL